MPREQVYIRGGHTLFLVRDWLQSEFCTLMTMGSHVLECRTRYGRLENQLFVRSDLQNPPRYEQSGGDEKRG